MTGSEFLVPDGMTLEAAGDALAGALELRDGIVHETDRTYYDTFDGLLRDHGLSLLHEDGELVLIEPDSGRVLAHQPAARPDGPLPGSAIPPGSVRDTVLPVIELRALLPLARIHARERPFDVLDDERKTVVRLRLEQPALIDGGGGSAVLPARLLIAPVRGYDDELARVRAAVERSLHFKPADCSLADDAVLASGGVPGGIKSKIEVALGYDQRADAAAATVLGALLDVIEANVEGTIDDLDSEFLHDLRVSVRRSRTVQRQLRRVFPSDQLARFRGEFRWLQQATGDARDLDVYVLEFDAMSALVDEAMRADLEPLLEVLRARRLAARRVLETALRSERATALLSGWRELLNGLEALPAHDRPDAARPIGRVAGERIRRVYKQMLRMGSPIDDSSPAEAYHELRKKGKELRYLLELFAAPLYPEEVVKPMIKVLKGLQDVLGRHQDREVQVTTLHALRDEVAAAEGGAGAVMAMGALVARLGEDKWAARAEFGERFAAFASRGQRKLVRDTFG